MFGQETDDLYIRSMFGCNARRVPMWMKVQANPDGTTMFVGASMQGNALAYGSTMTHQHIVGELIVRPHMVLESNHCRGHGLNGLAKECEMQEWVKSVILDPTGMVPKLKKDLRL